MSGDDFNPASILFDVNGTPLTVISGSLSITGSSQVTGSVEVVNQLTVTSTGSLPIIVVSQPNITGSVNVTNALFPLTGTVNIDRGNSTLLPLVVTGSVGVNGITFPSTMTVTGSVEITNQITVTSTGSLPVIVTSQPNITGTVGVSTQVVVTSTGSLPVIVQTLPQITGSVNVTNSLFSITGSVAVTNQLTVTTTGSLPVSVVTQPNITGSVSVTNVLFPVTGTVAVVNQLSVTSTGSLPVAVVSQPNITGSVNVTNRAFNAVVYGLLDNGVTNTDVRVTPTGELGVEIGGASQSAFGDLIVANNTPIIQFDFVHAGLVPASGSFNDRYVVTSSSGTGASLSTSNNRLVVQSGTSAGGFATCMSTKPAKYRAGQGMTARFTYAFQNSSANSTHLVGMASPSTVPPTDGYFFGYVGTTFGIMHRCAYFTDGPAGAITDHFIPQSSWNVDVCDGSNGLNNPSGYNLTNKISNGNVYQIRYPYLGYGNIKFFIQNPENSSWILVHIIKYAGNYQEVQVSNPSMDFYAGATNSYAGSTSTTNLIGYCGSVGVFLSGDRKFLGSQFGANSATKNATTTEAPFLSIANVSTINGVPNGGTIRLRQLSVSTTANTIVVLKIRRNQPLTTPSWTPVNGTATSAPTNVSFAQSMAYIDNTSTAFSTTPPATSNVIFNVTSGPAGNTTIDMTPYDMYLIPGEIWNISCVAGANSSTAVALNWQEEL